MIYGFPGWIGEHCLSHNQSNYNNLYSPTTRILNKVTNIIICNKPFIILYFDSYIKVFLEFNLINYISSRMSLENVGRVCGALYEFPEGTVERNNIPSAMDTHHHVEKRAKHHWS